MLRKVAETESQTSIASSLGIGQQFVSSILRRRSRPGPKVREIAAKKYGIPVKSWFSKQEQRVISASA